jgi:hypothetical protein
MINISILIKYFLFEKLFCSEILNRMHLCFTGLSGSIKNVNKILLIQCLLWASNGVLGGMMPKGRMGRMEHKANEAGEYYYTQPQSYYPTPAPEYYTEAPKYYSTPSYYTQPTPYYTTPSYYTETEKYYATKAPEYYTTASYYTEAHKYYSAPSYYTTTVSYPASYQRAAPSY